MAHPENPPESPYVFRASKAGFSEDGPALKVKEARMLGGIRLRYQERYPDPEAAAREPWCVIGHSWVVLSGRLRVEFDDHVVELDPGDMAHIPPGPEHRHRASAAGNEPVKYYVTSFTWEESKAPKPTAARPARG
jgi:hypothetical protein